MFAIARKATERMPSGRACGYPGSFSTREQAQSFLDAKKADGWNWADDMHVIETDGSIQVAYSREGKMKLDILVEGVDQAVALAQNATYDARVKSEALALITEQRNRLTDAIKSLAN